MSLPSSQSLRIGTRGSALALWQATAVRDMLAAHGVASELVIIKPEGDLDKQSSLRQIGGRGVFTSAIQQQMLAGNIDLAVHSTKDLPSLAPYGIAIAAFPQREDARDALISRHGVGLEALPPNPVIGTSSRRRAVQLQQVRPDAIIRDLRGNIDTRLQKGLSGDYDAVILAAAGLKRMGWDDQITELLPIEVSCPAPGQGALAVEAISGTPAWESAASLDDPAIRTSVMAERAFLRGVGGGCSTPIGAHAVVEKMHGISTVRFWAMLGAYDGSRLERFYAEWPAAQAGERAFIVADQMMRTIAPKWTGVSLAEPLKGRRILVTGSERIMESQRAELAKMEAEVFSLPTIQIESTPVSIPAKTDLIVLTSKHAVPAVDWRNVAALVAVVGEATANAVREVGIEPALVAEGPGGEALAAEIIAADIMGEQIVHVGSDIARPELADALTAAGARVTSLIGYVNRPVTAIDAELRDRIARGEMEAVTFASPSSVAAFVQLIAVDLPALSGAAMIAIGPTTARAMVDHNLPVHATAEVSTSAGITATLAQYFGGEEPAP